MSLVGFINQYREFPAPLVAIFESAAGRFKAVLPSGEQSLIASHQTMDDLRSLEGYLPGSALQGGSGDDRIYFGLSSQTVISIPQKGFGKALREAMMQCGAPDREVLQPYVDEAYAVGLGLSPRQLRESLAATPKLSVLLTSRKIKCKHHSAGEVPTAPTVVVQMKRPSGWTTLYRKGYKCGTNLADARVPRNVLIDSVFPRVLDLQSA